MNLYSLEISLIETSFKKIKTQCKNAVIKSLSNWLFSLVFFFLISKKHGRLIPTNHSKEGGGFYFYLIPIFIFNFRINSSPSRPPFFLISSCSFIIYFPRARMDDFLIILGLKSPHCIFFSFFHLIKWFFSRRFRFYLVFSHYRHLVTMFYLCMEAI